MRSVVLLPRMPLITMSGTRSMTFSVRLARLAQSGLSQPGSYVMLCCAGEAPCEMAMWYGDENLNIFTHIRTYR